MKKLNLLIILTSFIINGCSLLVDSGGGESSNSISGLSFDKKAMELAVGATDIINLAVSPSSMQSKKSISWDYDPSLVVAKTDNYSIILSAIKEGTCTIRATCEGKSASCALKITENGNAETVKNPYVYVQEDVVCVAPGATEKVCASLFGSTSSDANGFSFSCDKPSVVSLTTEGNYVWLTGMTEGMAKITVRHSKSQYPCSFLVNVAASELNIPYITTTTNVVTINKTTETEKKITVDVKNPAQPTYADYFTYNVVDSAGNPLINPPVQITAEGKLCSITPLETGVCYIKVSNQTVTYDLNILVRVIENIPEAYIDVNESIVTLEGGEPKTIEAVIKKDGETTDTDVNQYEWTFGENAIEYADCTVFGGGEKNKGNQLWLSAKKSGSFKVTVSHPAVSSPKEIIVISRNIDDEAASSRTYITTSQNYIELTPDSDPVNVSVIINNAEYGDENSLEWKIKNSPKDGTSDPVIIWNSGTGIVSSSQTDENKGRSAASLALTKITFGNAEIKPLREGTAEISVSHPKAIYDTRILVNVISSETAKKENCQIICGSSILMIKNGETEELTASVNGNINTEEEKEKIEWTIDNKTDFELTPNAEKANIKTKGTALCRGEISISHPKAEYPKKISVIGYSNEEELDALKVLATSQNVYTVLTGAEQNLYVNGFNISEEDRIEWTVKKGLGYSVDFTDENLKATVKGLKPGKAVINANLIGTDQNIEFYIDVKQDGLENEESPAYLTTVQNSVTVEEFGSADIEITPVNIKESEFKNTVWKNNSPELFEISSNGNTATINAKKNGSGSIEISHPLAKNSLKINVRIGGEYTYKNSDVALIQTEKDTVILSMDSGETLFTALLAHTETGETKTEGLVFASSDINVFRLTTSTDGSCLISPVSPGKAILTVRHSEAQYEKNVLVIIKRSSAEMVATPFITTTQNVITVLKGNYTPVSVTLNNKTDIDASKWSWNSTDWTIADIPTSSGNTAMISGCKAGTTKIKIKHSDCPNELEIIVICLEKENAAAKPFITTSSNIQCIKKGQSITIQTQMTGGNVADASCFVYSSADERIAFAYGSGENCYIKGIKSGQTRITISNTNYPDAYSKTILVRVEDTTDEECYITVTENVLNINPDDGETTVKATLENGTPEDKNDFTWWADDYNIVSLASNSNEASIRAVGKTGATYIHIKHPKVLKTMDIVVLCSRNSKFEFNVDSKTVTEKQMSFIPMKIPAVNGKWTVEYESLNENVCIATGSNQVCMLAGISSGSTSVKATMKTGNSVVAEAELAVIVKKAAEITNQIKTETTIINMDKEERRTILADIIGQEIKTSDADNIVWQSSDENVVSIMKTDGITTKSKNAVITAKSFGSAVITLTHAKCDSELTIYVNVPEKEVTTLSLDQSYIEMYKGDTTTKISATVLNGTTDDENSITWTAPKVDGTNIVSVSKGKGKSCNIIPRNIGSTIVRAQLPNGNYADCVVTVLSQAELKLETQTIRIVPGYVETVKYWATPSSAFINWVPQMNGAVSLSQGTKDYFTLSDNTTTHELTIAANPSETGSGIIYGYLTSETGTSKTQLNVSVEYNYELAFDTPGIIRAEPTEGKTVEVPFHVYPRNLEIEVSSSDESILQIKDWNIDTSSGNGKINVRLLKEGEGQFITVKATNPKDLINTPIERKQYINSVYDTIHIIPVFNYATGKFTGIDNSTRTIKLGDGESLSFYLDIQEKNADVSNIKVYYHPGADADTQIENGGKILLSNCSKSNGYLLNPEPKKNEENNSIYKISHKEDYRRMVYWVKEGYAPTWNNEIIDNWKKRVCKGVLTTYPNQSDYIFIGVKDITQPYHKAYYSGSWYYTSDSGRTNGPEIHYGEPPSGANITWVSQGYDYDYGLHNYLELNHDDEGDAVKGNFGKVLVETNVEYDPIEFRNITYWWLPGPITMASNRDHKIHWMPEPYNQDGTLRYSCHNDTENEDNTYGCKATVSSDLGSGIWSSHVNAVLTATAAKNKIRTSKGAYLSFTITRMGKKEVICDPWNIEVEIRECTMNQE